MAVAILGGVFDPPHKGHVALGRAAAVRVAAANGAPTAAVSFPDGATFAPVRVRVAVERGVLLAGRRVRMRAEAEARRVQWPRALAADAASRDSADFKNLLRLAARAVPRVKEQLARTPPHARPDNAH